jgi:hypothetical protein
MKFEKNIGKKDRAVRLIIAAVLVILTAVGAMPSKAIAITALIIAAVLAATAALSFCGLYTLLGKSTCCGNCQGKK